MILQALVDYYDRCREDPDETIPDFGYAPQQVGWVLHIGKDGSLVADPEDIRHVDEKGKKRPVEIELPTMMQKKTSGIASQFLWENTGYVLGADAKGKPERAREQFEAFRTLHHELLDSVDDEALHALLRFLDSWNPDDAPGLPYWDELCGQNLVFRYEGDRDLLHVRAKAKEASANHLTTSQSEYEGICLATGERSTIAKLHPAIKRVRNAQSAGASIVSFNANSFESYGKEQNLNAPLSGKAAFKYTTALNHLTRYHSRRKTRIGDTDVLFWATEASVIEDVFSWTADPMNEEQPTAEVKVALDSIRLGKKPRELELSVPFHVLGLTGNSARIAIRFWYSSSISEMADRIGRHFQDLRVIGSERDREYPGLNQLLRDTAPLGKFDRISPTLSSAMMRSILTDTPYPHGLIAAILDRIRSDGRITYLRAALIKAVLARGARLSKRGKEVTVKLDKSSTSVPYLLGRLFAILERIQEDANPGIKATIKDRYYGAASATPASVFGQLVRLSASHIKKADKRPYHEGLIQEVLGEIGELPKQLNLEDQGRFALGYYHQRQWFFTKKEDREE